MNDVVGSQLSVIGCQFSAQYRPDVNPQTTDNRQPTTRFHGEPQMSDNHIIRMSNIRKVYDTGKVKFEALKGIDLEVYPGEFVAIVGPSGSGKSTLMNLLGCLDTPTDGTYEIGGDNVAGVTRDELAEIRNRRVGFVFQSFNLLPHLTALENVELPMLFGGVAPKVRRARAAELLGKVGLGDRLDHKPTEISGGQMQRVAIARALAMNPDILLADEPTGNLDTTSGTDIMSIFNELWQSGRTLIIITHDPALARRASRVVEIRDGRITSDTRNEAAA
jgi:putative ABC transport system ATP-binding protein